MPARVSIGDSAMPFELRMAQEGEWRTLYAHGTTTVTVANTASTVTIVQNPAAQPIGSSSIFGMPYIGRRFYVQSITVSASNAGVYQIGSSNDVDAKYTPYVDRFILAANQPLTIPVNQFWGHERLEPANGAAPSLALQSRQMIPALSSDTAVTGSILIRGYVVTDDLNWYAQKTLLVLGDSLSHGDGWGPTTADANRYPTVTNDMWTHIVKDTMIGSGKDVRLVSMAIPGFKTSNHIYQQRHGRYDAIKRDMLIVALGTNDGLTAVAPATYDANIREIWSRHNARFPRAPMLLVTPGPLGVLSDETLCAPIISKAVSTVAAINNPLLSVANISTAFDKAVSTNFRTASDLIHWSRAGHAAVASVVNSAIAARGWSI